MKGKYKVVHVKWIDSFGCTSSWGDIPQGKQPPAHYCYSVGWLVSEGPNGIVVVPHMSPEHKEIHAVEQGCGEMTIPKVSIVEMITLSETL